MPEELNLIWILAIGLGLACLFGYICQKMKLSPILGYLFAGYLIGPNFPGYVADLYMSEQLANIGVTLLMFAVGLSFDWKDLVSVKKIVLPGAISLSALSIAAGISLSLFLGGTLLESIIIGIAICVSSTVVIVRVLADQNLIHTFQGHLVIGWTIVEDLISVLGLILLPSFVLMFQEGESPLLSIVSTVALVFLKIVTLAFLVYFVGEKLIDKLLKSIARTRSHELFTLAILTCVFLIAVSSSYFFGVSIAIGAFIAGTVVGKTELSHQAAANALPMRDAFAVIFFLSVGMLFNPLAVAQNLPLFFGILAILLFLRPLYAFTFLKIMRYPSTTSFTVALAISQIGEYSFILAEEGSKLKILPDSAYDILVACAFISIALNPFLFQIFKPLLTKKHLKNPTPFAEHKINGPSSFLPRAVVIGFGPVGKAAAKTLKEHNYDVLVIDQNIDTISNFKNKKMQAIFGDATQLTLLERAEIENVPLVVITTPDATTSQLIIQMIQHINPQCFIISRTHYKADLEKVPFGDIPTVCDEEAAAEKMIKVLHKELSCIRN